MNKEQKQEVIEALKNKFSQYSNFYITDTQNLSVAQITNLRRHCFDKQVEMKVAKNTLIKKALESLDNDRYSGVYDSLHQVTALMFSDSPKEPALIISSFRKSLNGEKPLLKAAFLNGDIFVGDNQLVALTKIKTKNELIGEVIGLLMSPIQRVIGALQNRPETPEITEAKAEVAQPKTAAPEAKPEPGVVAETKPESAVSAKTETAEPKADAPIAKTEADESKAVAKEAPATEAKAKITEPVAPKAVSPAKAEATEPKAVATEATPAVQPAAETGPEVAEPASPKVEASTAKAEDAEPKATASEAVSGPKTATEIKSEETAPAPRTLGSKTKGSEKGPEA